MAREEGQRTRFIRAGFAAPSEAQEHLAEVSTLLGVDGREVLERVSARVLDPDQALGELAHLARDAPEAARASLADLDVVATALVLLGASTGLASFLRRHPETLPEIHAGAGTLASRDELQVRLAASVGVGEDCLAEDGGFGLARAQLQGTEARAALRIRYRVELAKIAAFDLLLEQPTEHLRHVARALADLAGEALDAALMVARADISAPPAGFGRFPAEQVDEVRLAVIGMGKSGAEELNYISDVDVMFVVDVREGSELPQARAIEIGTRLASTTMRVIDEVNIEPALWEVDANLRPEGKDGALVRTVDSYVKYYERWAKNWEFQALLKARPMAGDLTLGEALVARVAPFVWASAGRDDFVEQVRAMRRRVTDHIPNDEVDIQLKLGPGGLRDIEFTVQLLQLAHGQNDEALRVRGTLEALERLRERGYIGRDHADEFAEDYRFLRLLEHRLQLRRLRRTHLMPRDDEGLRVLARAAGFANGSELVAHWQRVKVRVRGLHEQVFYAPVLAAVASLGSDGFQLTSERAADRLRAIGYRDPKGALGHIEALIKGISRRAQMQRNLLPVLLDWFAQGANPDQGLLAFRKLSEHLGDAPWYLRMLRDSATAAHRLTTLLSGSKFAAVFLELYPEAVTWLDDDRDLAPRSAAALRDEVTGTIRRHAGDEESMRRAVRTFRRREVLRLALGSMLGVTDIDATAAGLTATATATLQAALLAVTSLDEEAYPPFAIIAMGRYGGGELGFGSDLDVLYVYDPASSESDIASRLAKRLVSRIGEFVADPRLPIELDADLRPEGKSGPLARSIEAYRSYYRKWSLGWEAQALLRAMPVAGDERVRAAFAEIADETRYPTGLSGEQLREIRRIKARVESERLPRGADPARHVKLGRGSLSDVEWLAQTLQLQHAHEVPALRTASTLDALAAACEAGHLAPDDEQTMREAWLLAARIRSAIFLYSNRASDLVPLDVEQLDGIARLLSRGPGHAQALEEEYLAVTRRARKTFERLFYES